MIMALLLATPVDSAVACVINGSSIAGNSEAPNARTSRASGTALDTTEERH